MCHGRKGHLKQLFAKSIGGQLCLPESVESLKSLEAVTKLAIDIFKFCVRISQLKYRNTLNINTPKTAAIRDDRNNNFPPRIDSVESFFLHQL
jgi:hypothetical protein